MTIAILSALPEEQQGLVELLQNAQQLSHAGRRFWRGTLHGVDVICALSGIGKVDGHIILMLDLSKVLSSEEEKEMADLLARHGSKVN